jgi:hypothetical protein
MLLAVAQACACAAQAGWGLPTVGGHQQAEDVDDAQQAGCFFEPLM